MGRDAVRFEALFRAHHPHILAYCRRRAPADAARDAAEEVFLVAWRRWEDVPAPPDDRPWLYGVAYRVLANQRRGSERRHRLASRLQGEATTSTTGIDEAVVASEEHAAVRAALDRLSADDQEVLRLAAWEGLRAGDIAAVLGLTADAAAQRLHRARKRLQREYEAARRPTATRRRRHA